MGVPKKKLRREDTNLAKADDNATGGGGGGGGAGGSGAIDEPVPGENARLTHESVDTRGTRNIKMKQHLCVKHALPKTRLTNAILYENVSHDRHLEMKLSGLQHNKFRSSVNMDINKRAFIAQQDRKRRKWKREDEVRIAGMNLPSLTSSMDKRGSNTGGTTPAIPRRPSMFSLYHSIEQDDSPESEAAPVRKPVLPMMKVRRERTEILSHHDKVFVTKLPAVVEIDQRKLSIFNSYCGKSLLDKGMPSRDDRFRRLHTTLSSTKLNEKDEYPAENLTAKARLSKYVPSASPSSSEPLPPRSGARVMVASRGKPIATGLDLSISSAPSGERSHVIDYVTEHVQGRDSILELFKSKDIKQLARSLTTDAAGMGMGMGKGKGEGTKGEKGEQDTERSIPKPRHQEIFVPVVDVFYKVKASS